MFSCTRSTFFLGGILNLFVAKRIEGREFRKRKGFFLMIYDSHISEHEPQQAQMSSRDNLFRLVVWVLQLLALLSTSTTTANGMMSSLQDHKDERVSHANISVGIIGMGDMGKMYTKRISAAGWR